MEKHTKQAESRVKIGLKRVIAFILVTRTKIRKSFESRNSLTHLFARRGATIFNCIYIYLNKYMHIYVFCMQKSYTLQITVYEKAN